MAKVKMPLGSFEARGALAKGIVYFPWKGVNCVRQYVIPANPQTDAQTTQRNKLTAAVTEFHAALYTAADMVAWNRLAGIIKGAMTGFNAMCRTHIKEAILTNTWERMREVYTMAVVWNSFKVRVEKDAAGNVPTVRWGTRPTFLPNSSVMAVFAGNTWEYEIPNLTADTLYYFSIDVGTSGTDYGRVGIYAQRTGSA